MSPSRPAHASAPVPAGLPPEAPQGPAPAVGDPVLRRIEVITRWLDQRYLDPIIGFLLPALGDFLPLLFGLYVLFTAARRGLPVVVIARMILNLAVDALVGLVPVIGDLFDVAFRAHRRNADLLMRRHEQGRATLGDWLLVTGATLLLLSAVLLPILLVSWSAGAVIRWLGG